MPAFLPKRKIGGVTVGVVPILAAAVISIFAYGAILRKMKAKDLLERKLTEHPGCGGFDGWGVLHMFFFAGLGFLYPERYVMFLGVGVAWEFIEDFLGQNRVKISGSRVQLIGEQDEEGRPTGNDDAWWYGRASDVMWNSVGYILGAEIGKRYWKDDGAAVPTSPETTNTLPLISPGLQMALDRGVNLASTVKI